ncbi:4Fe-4S single cluster domain-containing protein [Bacillus marasmi]|uniref:4Fe-4S single cluster domain-containing protein n=1 Tax=Bacillus marasmi TaxID=1926279 RepID=UPI001FE55E5C|nr:4Fe-4S single cluster domain-containing protein [Bacillus marasmi]
MRFCIWVQGCPIQCKGCGVPWTWSDSGGKLIDVEGIFRKITESVSENGIEGITFLGGEPFAQAKSLAILAKKCKEIGLSIMTFTGYTIEKIRKENNANWIELLNQTDLLIDGPFLETKLDLSRPWVGSSNQRYHFLTERYRHLEGKVSTIPNRLEVRISNRGIVEINGMITQMGISELFENVALSQRINPNIGK